MEELEQAIDFELEDNEGNTVRLSDYKGKKIVLYFYPKDLTPGCTKQACGFRDLHEVFEKNNIVVLGVSKDGVKSHQKFIEKYSLPFTLLSDPELKVIQAYGAYGEKKLYGKTSMGVIRTTFIIDEDFKIIKIMKKVKAEQNAQDILDLLGI